jgi:formylmethanofuran dehydrogenase subunit B
MMLGFESNTVIGLRMLRLVSGGSDALHEMHLMIGEKVDAALESGANVMAGATAEAVIDRYRQHVAANAARLSLPA